ncbi:MAG: adenine deaminase [Firmicutes bacterium]|nr:adenine deaminase [Bacillota bacterium]
MGRGRLRAWNREIMNQLIRVSRGIEEADLFFTGGEVLNVYSGEVARANLAVKGERIAYLGGSEKMVGERTRVIDTSGRLLVPGYIEPHAHPVQLYNPLTHADQVLTRGTTLSVNDNLFFFNAMPLESFMKMIEDLSSHPVKMLWSARLDPQTYTEEAATRFSPENLSRMIRHPWFVQVGELTDWPSLLGGNESMQEWMVEAAEWGKRAEGHAPGASENTLNPLAAAGVTACHESIKLEDVLRRLRLGMYATLRCSSLRPDLPEILAALMEWDGPVAWERVMMTTDSPTPTTFARGFTDLLLGIALERGMPPVTAYQLVTRNPAVYYGLDDEIGGLAPGRVADILVLDAIDRPVPRQVYADGRLVVDRTEGGVKLSGPPLTLDWEELGLRPLTSRSGRRDSDWLVPEHDGYASFPVMSLVDPVITRQVDIELGSGDVEKKGTKVVVRPGSGLCFINLVDRDYRTISQGLLQGFAHRLDGMAASYTGSFDLLVIGQDSAAMHRALKRMEELGGGIVIVQDREVAAEIALPLGGMMSPLSLSEVTALTAGIEETMYKAGYPHHDLIYTLLFLSSTHLPELRLTRDGLWNVKERRLLRRSRILRE